MRNLLTGSVIASPIFSTALNVAQYNGWLSAPENLTFIVNQPVDPIVQAAEAYAGR